MIREAIVAVYLSSRALVAAAAPPDFFWLGILSWRRTSPLPLLQWRGALCTNWLKMVHKIHSISNGSSRISSFMQWIADWRPLKLLCWVCVHMGNFGHGNFRKMRLSNWKFTSQKQKGENSPHCFQIILASEGVLCARLLGFYMTAAIACSSCAEFVRTALPTNQPNSLVPSGGSKYVVVSPIHLLSPNEAKTLAL